MKPRFIRPELLTHPQIPKPLHGLAPRVVLGQEWWDVQRKAAYEINNGCCWACGVHKRQAEVHQWLEAHECYRIDYREGRMQLKEIVALCHLCHNYIHLGRLAMLVDSGEKTQKFYDQVVKHGDAIIEKARLDFPDAPDEDLMADWADWRMVISGKKYGPTSDSYEAWRRGEWRNWKPRRSEKR